MLVCVLKMSQCERGEDNVKLTGSNVNKYHTTDIEIFISLKPMSTTQRARCGAKLTTQITQTGRQMFGTDASGHEALGRRPGRINVSNAA